MGSEKPRPVLTKKDFVRRYAQGEFGNHSPTWDSLGEWIKDPGPKKGLYHIRNRVKGGPTWYNLNANELVRLWEELTAVLKVAPSSLYISQMCPTEKTVIQGEVQEGLWGLDLTFTNVAKPMREALGESTKLASGLTAKLILKAVLCQRSWDWLHYLLEAYPGHVVEFTTLSEKWGTIPGYNTIFWEVRRY